MKRIILPLILGICTLFPSCEEKMPEERLVSVSLSYSLSADNGKSMYSTRAAGSDIFNDFYAKIMDGTLIAPDYNLTFTDAVTGETFPVQGKWSSEGIVSLKPGTYDVTGKSTAEGNNIQQKCSITLNDRVSVNEGSTSITIDASYDCSLIIFNDSTIAEIYNDSGNSTKETLFRFGDCFYAFVRTTLYDDSTKDKACLSGILTNGPEFTVPTAGLTFGPGKYDVYSSINAAFSLPEMEDGGDGGQEGGEDSKYVQFEDANFKAYCIEHYDKDGDGEISEAEALIPTSLEINTDEIESLEGINNFANITELMIKGSGGKFGGPNGVYTGTGDTDAVPDPEPGCMNVTGKLLRLDISQLYNLESLSISCNVLEDLKLPDSANLCDIYLFFTRLKTLDISNNTALVYLYCSYNQISYIYVWPGFNESEYPNFIKDDTATYVEKGEEQIDTKDYPSAIRGIQGDPADCIERSYFKRSKD